MSNTVQRATRRWSDIQGLAAVAIDTGKKVGTLDDFYFDAHTGTILAFLIKTGLLSHRTLRASTVNAIGVDALTFIGEEDALLKESTDGEHGELQPRLSGKNLLNYRILSEGGTVFGIIGDVLLDIASDASSPSTPSAARISAFEMAGGGLREIFGGRHPTIAADQVRRYGEDVIVISDAVAQSL